MDKQKPKEKAQKYILCQLKLAYEISEIIGRPSVNVAKFFAYLQKKAL